MGMNSYFSEKRDSDGVLDAGGMWAWSRSSWLTSNAFLHTTHVVKI